jgi:acetyl-CoA carboxylase carboxyltransferase component
LAARQRRREEFAEQLGGPERVERQHAGGRYTVRERIAKLADPGSFHELGKIAGSASYDRHNDLTKLVPSNFVFGRARLDGRPVVIGGDDFTVRGGSADATIKGKHFQCEQMAKELQLHNRFIRKTFGRYLTDDVVKSLLESPEGLKLGGSGARSR